MFYVIKQYAGNNGLWIQKTYQIIAFFGKKNIFSNSNYCEVLVAGPIAAEIITAYVTSITFKIGLFRHSASYPLKYPAVN